MTAQIGAPFFPPDNDTIQIINGALTATTTGGLEFIQAVTASSGASITIDSANLANYDTIVLMCHAITDSNNASWLGRFNNSSVARYNYRDTEGTQAATQTSLELTEAHASNKAPLVGMIILQRVRFSGTVYLTARGALTGYEGLGIASLFYGDWSADGTTGADMTSFVLLPSTGNCTGHVQAFGVRES